MIGRSCVVSCNVLRVHCREERGRGGRVVVMETARHVTEECVGLLVAALVVIRAVTHDLTAPTHHR